MGTGGLDFLIAYALMILCHSLFKVVVDDIEKRGKIAVLYLLNEFVPTWTVEVRTRKSVIYKEHVFT